MERIEGPGLAYDDVLLVPRKASALPRDVLTKTRFCRNVELQINDTVLDLRDVPVSVYPDPYWGLNRLLNFALDVRTHTDVRNFLYLDSVLISADW